MTQNTQTDFPVRLKKKFIEKANGHYVVPGNVSDALRLSTNPNCSALEFASTIELDVSLAIDVLRLANSPLFAGQTPTANLSQAVVRLGIRRCANLVISNYIRELFRKLPLDVEWAREVLNKHSLVTASACTLISREFDLGFAGDEYTAGMLHDIGRLVLAAAIEEDISNFDDFSFDESTNPLIQERMVLGTDHCQFGAWFIELVSLPYPLVEVAKWHHHELGTADIENQLLVSLIRAADHFANHIQRENPIEEYDAQSNTGLIELSILQSNKQIVEVFSRHLASFEDEILTSVFDGVSN